MYINEAQARSGNRFAFHERKEIGFRHHGNSRDSSQRREYAGPVGWVSNREFAYDVGVLKDCRVTE